MLHSAEVPEEWEGSPPPSTLTDIVASPFQLPEGLIEHDPLQDFVVCREISYSGLPHWNLAVLENPKGARRIVSVQRLKEEAGADSLQTPGFSADGLLGCHVRHPNVFSVIDVVQANGELMLVLDYVVSETLGRLEADGNRLPVPISVAIARDMLQALSAAHGACRPSGESLDIVHANIEPQNVLVGVDGIARLVHYGCAAKQRGVRPSGSPGKGKSRYIAPEQVFDQRVDARTDVFQVGVVLWESLTGRPLIAGGSAVDCMLRFISNGARPPSEMNPRVDRALDAVLLRALEPSPERRFQTAAEFAEALEAAAAPAPRAEVVRYLAAVARASIDEQRALLGDGPVEETPTTCVRLASTVRGVSEFRPIEPELMPEGHGLPPALEELLDDGRGLELASHWSSLDADERTAVDGAPPKPENAAVATRKDRLGPATTAPLLPTAAMVLTPPIAAVARARSSSEPEIAFGAEPAIPDDFIELADAVSDLDEPWVHPLPLLKARAPASASSNVLPMRRSLARRVGRAVMLVLTWTLAFIFVFASTFFVTKTIKDAAYRTRVIAAVSAVFQRAPSVAVKAAAKTTAAKLPQSSQGRTAEAPQLVPSGEGIAPPSAAPAPRVLRLEELPLDSKKPLERTPVKSKKTPKTLAAPASESASPAASAAATVTLTEE